MKFFLILFMSLCLLYSCGSSNKKSDGKQYDLSTKIIKGPKYKTRMNTDMTITTSMMVFSIDMVMKMRMDLAYEILPDTANMKQVKITYDEIDMKMEMKGLDKIPGAGDRIPPMPDMSKTSKMLKGASITLLVNDSGIIADVIGLEDLKTRLDLHMDSLESSDASGGQAKAMVAGFYSKKNMQNTFGMMFAYYSMQPLKIGDTWTNKTVTSVSNMDMNLNNKFELMDVKNNIAEIKVNSIYDAKMDMKNEQIKIGAEMDGTQKGAVKMDLTNGQIIESKLNMDISGKMNANGIPVPMKIKGSNVISKL
jgi:Family of unknown function (DUF6263)